MPSRKRAKGRERKLKQQAREPVERSVSQSNLSGWNTNLPEQNVRRIEQEAEDVRCYHGSYKLPRGHPVYEFFTTFQEGCVLDDDGKKIDIVGAVYETFEKHEDVWKDDAVRKMTIDIMSRIGTSFLLDNDSNVASARRIAEVIIYLENYDGEVIFNSVLSKGTEEIGYILCAGEREIVRFYKKRIPCSCLDEMYSEIKKSQVRGSRCFHCEQTVKRKDLKACSRCKLAQYCSKECQAVDWPSHKERCMGLADFHKGVNKVETARRNEKRVCD